MFRRSLPVLLALTTPFLNAQAPPNPLGQGAYESRCSVCHGADGNGGEMGPAIARRLRALDDAKVTAVIREGLPTRGMPGFKLADTELKALIAHVRTFRPRRNAEEFQQYPLKATLTTGATLDGTVISEGFQEAALATGPEKRVHLLRKAGAGKFREVTSEVNWNTYNGDIGGNRYTTLTQINKTNVNRVAPRWSFTLPEVSPLQGTPLVVDGLMYVTAANLCYALDAGSGRVVWKWQRPRTQGLVGGAAGGTNRGAAYANGRIFMATDNAHMIALDRWTGKLLWESTVVDSRLNYTISSAPIAVGDIVITGTAGGEEGARGLIAAYDQKTGKEVWRFWTVPARGEPGSETWQGTGIDHPGAVAWFTGVYDPETDLVFWQTGNPGEDYNGDQRKGDNLYSDAIVALEAKTGKLRWYYQTTPHDLWDWDATETPLVINTNWQGQPRKLLVQGNRNGFFYVWDRTNGKLLLARQFINTLTWAKEIGKDGRPVLVPGQEPKPEGTRVCPSQDGATNWYSPSFNPATGLFYMQTNEKCSIYTKREDSFELGRAFLGGAQRVDPADKPVRILRALDLQTGKVKWEIPQIGTANTWGGTLATSTGLVFFGEDSGSFVAADAVTGKVLWTYQGNVNWHASPMAYQFDKKQFIAVAAGTSVVAFGLAE